MSHVKSLIRILAAGTVFALALSLLLIPSGCNKIDEDDLNSAIAAVYDSLSQIYNGVEIYKGVTAGGNLTPPFETSSSAAYDGGQHYMKLNIPRGLNPGDQVFVVAESRFTRSISQNINSTPQSVITITKDADNPRPDPSGSSQSGLFLAAPHSSDDTWNLQQPAQTIDRSGVHIQPESAGTWNTAYVNFYARVYSSGTPSGTLSVSGRSLSVIVVRE